MIIKRQSIKKETILKAKETIYKQNRDFKKNPYRVLKSVIRKCKIQNIELYIIFFEKMDFAFVLSLLLVGLSLFFGLSLYYHFNL